MTTHLEFSAVFSSLTTRIRKDKGVPNIVTKIFKKEKAIEKAYDFLASVAPPEYFRIHHKIQLPRHSAYRGSGYSDLSSMDPNSMEFITEAQSLLLPINPQEVLKGLHLLQYGHNFSIRSHNEQSFCDTECNLYYDENNKLSFLLKNSIGEYKITLENVDVLIVSNSIAINSRLDQKNKLKHKWSLSLRVGKIFFDFTLNTEMNYSLWYHTFCFLMREQNIGADRNPTYIIALRNWFRFTHSEDLGSPPKNVNFQSFFSQEDSCDSSLEMRESPNNMIEISPRFKSFETEYSSPETLNVSDISKLFQHLGLYIPKSILNRACEVAGKSTKGKISFYQFAYILREIHKSETIGELFNKYTNRKPWMNENNFRKFLSLEQKENITSEVALSIMKVSGATYMEDGTWAFNKEGFVKFLFSMNNYAVPTTLWTSVQDDLTFPLSHYWISSIQESGEIVSNPWSSLDSTYGEQPLKILHMEDYLKKILLSSSRCLELECYDDNVDSSVTKVKFIPSVKNLEPITFTNALEIICKYSFLCNINPLILIIRMKSSRNNQIKVVSDLKNILGSKIYTLKKLEEYGPNWPSPKELEKNIIIGLRSKKEERIIGKLQDLCALWYHEIGSENISNKQIKSFSRRKHQFLYLNHNQFTTLCNENPEALFSFTLNNIVMVRSSHTNQSNFPNKPMFLGCQILNINRSQDEYHTISKTLFNFNSRIGYVLKPKILLPLNNESSITNSIECIDSNCRKILHITLVSSSMLPRTFPDFKDLKDKYTNSTIEMKQLNNIENMDSLKNYTSLENKRGSIQIALESLTNYTSHFAKITLISLSSSQTKQSKVGTSNIFATEWNETFSFQLGTSESSTNEFLKIDIYETKLKQPSQIDAHSNQQISNTLEKRKSTTSLQFSYSRNSVESKLVGEQLLPMSQLKQGFRSIPLCNKNGKFLGHGGILVNIKIEESSNK